MRDRYNPCDPATPRITRSRLQDQQLSYNPGTDYPDYRPNRRNPSTVPRPHCGRLDTEPGVDPHLSEPHVDLHHTSRHFHGTGCNFGRGAQSTPPSPTPSPRALCPLSPPISRGLSVPVTLQSHNRPQADTTEPMHMVPNHLDLGDIYELDASYVQLRVQGCVRKINTPPRGHRGPKGRWYFVCIGKVVGIFNDWFVYALVRTSSLAKIIYMSEVYAATNGVSGNCQQSVSSEAVAYTAFKQALLQGKVWITS